MFIRLNKNTNAISSSHPGGTPGCQGSGRVVGDVGEMCASTSSTKVNSPPAVRITDRVHSNRTGEFHQHPAGMLA